MPETLYDYFGLDIGDGETAVVWARQGQSAEPQVLEIRGSKNLITALAVDADDRRYIGEEALQIPGAQRVYLRFKSQFLTREPARRYLREYAGALLEALRQEGNIPDLEAARFFVGCPSGWPEDSRESYRLLLEQAGFRNVRIVSESRAALVFAQESGELRIAGDILHKPSLIIDAGSSTTDFTYVEALEERPLRDAGEVSLGAGLLDELLLDYTLKRADSAILRALEEYPALRPRCEFEARRVKEMYFTAQLRGTPRAYPCESSLRLYTDPPLRLDILCDDAIMEELLRRPLEALGGQSYTEAYRHALENIRGAMPADGPEVILLTGGASRMPFMRRIAREIFPDATLIYGNEPEYAIARGLCYALRMEERRADFARDVEAMIRSDAVEEAVAEALPALFEEVHPLIIDHIVGVIAPAVYGRWQRGDIETLEEMTASMMEEGQRFLSSEALREECEPLTARWLNSLRPRLERITNPICDRYQLPRASLRLPDFVRIGADMPLQAEGLLDFSPIKLLIDVVVASLLASLAGGAGTALVLSGPLGLAAGFVVGLAAAWAGTEYAEKLILTRSIPLAARRLLGKRLFAARMRRARADMLAQLRAQMAERNPELEAMAGDIAQSIEEQLHREMERAILLVR